MQERKMQKDLKKHLGGQHGSTAESKWNMLLGFLHGQQEMTDVKAAVKNLHYVESLISKLKGFKMEDQG